MPRPQHRQKVTGGEIDDRLVGAQFRNPIPVKPHCPECGYMYRGAKGKKRGVAVCGYCLKGRKHASQRIDVLPEGER